MWEQKQLKNLAKSDLKDNYLHCLMVSLVVVALMGNYGFLRSSTITNTLKHAVPITTNAGILADFLANIFGTQLNFLGSFFNVTNASTGVLANIVNSFSSSGSLIFSFLNVLNNIVFSNNVIPGIIMALGAIVYVLYWVFVQNVLVVGRHRFFLENRSYHATPAERLVFIFRLRRTKRVAYAMFLRFLLTLLWSFTIVGGFIVFYAYRMVPAILAENPDISPLKALNLSRILMKKNKWKTFKLDLSFLGWNLLSLLTFNLLNALFVTPYALATNAELYMFLRREHLAKNPADAIYFNDELLEIPREKEGCIEYPEDKFSIPCHHTHLSLNYKRKYSVLDIIMLFFTFAMIGFVYEVLYFIVREGILVKRGTMHGPWLPIYGFGGVMSLMLLKRFAAKPLKTFFLSMLLCGTMEYTTAWFLETFFQKKWWDYSGYFFNIQGRICAEGLIVFGLGCCLGIYVLSPSLASFYQRIPKKTRIAITTLLTFAFVGDFAYSAVNPNLAGVDSH